MAGFATYDKNFQYQNGKDFYNKRKSHSTYWDLQKLIQNCQQMLTYLAILIKILLEIIPAAIWSWSNWFPIVF